MSFKKINMSDHSAENTLKCETNIVLVSGNPNKAQEISKILESVGDAQKNPIGILPVDLTEIQGDLGKDYMKIAKDVTIAKVKECWRKVNEMIQQKIISLTGRTMFIIEDSSFFLLGAENNFPGHLIKGFTPRQLIDHANGLELAAFVEQSSSCMSAVAAIGHTSEVDFEQVYLTTKLLKMKDSPCNTQPRHAKALSQFACFVIDPSVTFTGASIPDSKIVFVQGSCTGSVSRRIMGTGGFAWDHCFVPDDATLFREETSSSSMKQFSGMTFSEMIDIDPSAKNMISQRYDAVVQLSPVIKYFKQSLVQPKSSAE